MIEMRTSWVSSDSTAGMALAPFGSRSSTPLIFDLRSNITINKTWHANCRKRDVSTILDWLVK